MCQNVYLSYQLYCNSESEGVYEEQYGADKTETEKSFLSAQIKEQLKNKRMLFSENQIELSTVIGEGLYVFMHPLLVNLRIRIMH